jgi:hypothetical protein
MKNRLLNAFLVLLLAAIGPLAAEWKGKDFMQWTPKDVESMLTDSPWAKDVTVAIGVPRGSDDVGTVGGGGRARGGRGAGVADEPAAPTMTLVLSWRSALPIKQAITRKRMGASSGITPELYSFLTQTEMNYVIGVTGIPARLAQAVQSQGSVEGSMLKRDKKSPILPMGVNLQQGEGNTVEAYYFFPKTDLIVSEDKEIEVVIKIGQFEVKKKFTTKDMIFGGKLEL